MMSKKITHSEPYIKYHKSIRVGIDIEKIDPEQFDYVLNEIKLNWDEKLLIYWDGTKKVYKTIEPTMKIIYYLITILIYLQDLRANK